MRKLLLYNDHLEDIGLQIAQEIYIHNSGGKFYGEDHNGIEEITREAVEDAILSVHSHITPEWEDFLNTDTSIRSAA